MEWKNGVVKSALTTTIGRTEEELQTIVLAEKQSAHHSAPVCIEH